MKTIVIAAAALGLVYYLMNNKEEATTHTGVADKKKISVKTFLNTPVTAAPVIQFKK